MPPVAQSRFCARQDPLTISGVSGASGRFRLTDGFLSPSASETPVTGSC